MFAGPSVATGRIAVWSPRRNRRHPRSVLAARASDVLSCVDTGEGRHIADRLSSCVPLFVGVAIPTEPTADGGRRISEVYGRVDYVYPGSSSMDRGVYDGALLRPNGPCCAASTRLKVADGFYGRPRGSSRRHHS